MFQRVIDHEFAVWAFGDVWYEFLVWEKDTIDLVDAWNYRHAHQYYVNPEDYIRNSMREMNKIYQQYRGDQMDKKMHKVTKSIKVAEKDVKKGKKKEAVKVLKKAEKKNEKLVKIDREVRDPMIKECKKEMKKKPMTKGKK